MILYELNLSSVFGQEQINQRLQYRYSVPVYRYKKLYQYKYLYCGTYHGTKIVDPEMKNLSFYGEFCLICL